MTTNNPPSSDPAKHGTGNAPRPPRRTGTAAVSARQARCTADGPHHARWPWRPGAPGCAGAAPGVVFPYGFCRVGGQVTAGLNLGSSSTRGAVLATSAPGLPLPASITVIT